MLECGETDLDFYSRRALEEAQAALDAPSPIVAVAHRHMAAAYTARLRDKEQTAASINDLLSALDDEAAPFD